MVRDTDKQLEEAADELQYAIRWFFHMWISRDGSTRWDKADWRTYLTGYSHKGDGSRPWDWERIYQWWRWPISLHFWKECIVGTIWLFNRWFTGRSRPDVLPFPLEKSDE